jgi:hypothetical protein
MAQIAETVATTSNGAITGTRVSVVRLEFLVVMTSKLARLENLGKDDPTDQILVVRKIPVSDPHVVIIDAR